MARWKEQYGEEGIDETMHPAIRSEEACWLSSSRAVALAQKHNTRLHILHISTARETHLFRNDIPLKQKRITAEACIHHLWFTDADYATKGAFVKWNPAVKTAADRAEIWAAVLDNRIDIIATDHAPHTLAEKQSPSYFQRPSGGPLVQHALVAMLEKTLEGHLTLEQVVEKMCHAPADCFGLRERGYLREGYHADLVLVRPAAPWTVARENILYKCGWSPFEGQTFAHQIEGTILNGQLKYYQGKFDESLRGQRLYFDRT
jgi:dihydroorotase